MSGSSISWAIMQVCTLLQTDNHTSNPPLVFYRLDALPAAQPTASKHWRQSIDISGLPGPQPQHMAGKWDRRTDARHLHMHRPCSTVPMMWAISNAVRPIKSLKYTAYATAWHQATIRFTLTTTFPVLLCCLESSAALPVSAESPFCAAVGIEQSTRLPLDTEHASVITA